MSVCFRRGGYRNFGEYVRTECGMSESAASRQINIMEYFSEEGNSPKLAEKWVGYSSSKLQELLSMTEEQREKVNPKMTVLQIRNIRKSGECQDKGQMETGSSSVENPDSGQAGEPETGTTKESRRRERRRRA